MNYLVGLLGLIGCFLYDFLAGAPYKKKVENVMNDRVIHMKRLIKRKNGL